MNILFIIGNGLDLALDMKTDYQSFYDYYLSIETNDECINAMKKHIGEKRFENWADLERGLGEYTASMANFNDFLNCLYSLKNALKEYLQLQEKTAGFSGDSKKFYHDLYSPEYYLDAQVKNKYDLFTESVDSDSVNLSIITFNYTKTIEKLLYSRLNGTSVLHLHGTLSEGIIMGVNDLSQIANVDFRKEQDIDEEVVKPSFNDACLNNRNFQAASLIDESNLIVIYGTSMGETDNKWWIQIGQRLMKDDTCMLLFFVYDVNKDVRLHPNYVRRWTKDIELSLLSKLRVSSEKQDEVLRRVCIAINKNIFINA